MILRGENVNMVYQLYAEYPCIYIKVIDERYRGSKEEKMAKEHPNEIIPCQFNRFIAFSMSKSLLQEQAYKIKNQWINYALQDIYNPINFQIE